MLRKAIWILLVAVAMESCADATSFRNPHKSADALTVTFAGDVLLDRGVRKTIQRHSVEYLFHGVSPYFYDSDYTIVNLECPITDIDAPLMKKYIFRADGSCAAVLRKVGVTHCAMANNHIMDQGFVGIGDAYKNLVDAGISTIGYGLSDTARSRPAMLKKNGIEVAVFNDCAIMVENYVSPAEGHGILNVPVESLLPIIKVYRQQHPGVWIVALLHWGSEFREHPSPSQRMDASRLIAAGVDVIVGHHPHVVQDIDTIRGRMVYYSIGNFVFDQRNPSGRKALMPVITFQKDAILHHVLDIDIVKNCPEVVGRRD